MASSTRTSGTDRGRPERPYAGSRSGGVTETTNHYQRLGVTPAASTEEIRAAFHVLARRLHPDRMVDAAPAERALAERRMREINESWAVLRDRESRRRYDATLHGAWVIGGSAGAAPGANRFTPDGNPQASPYAGTARLDEDLLDDDEGPAGPFGLFLSRHLPWILFVVLLGGIFVFTAYATSRGGDLEPIEPVRFQEGCVNVSPGPVTTSVPCDGPHELRIVARVGETEPCPAGTERRRLGVDGLLDCVTTT